MPAPHSQAPAERPARAKRATAVPGRYRDDDDVQDAKKTASAPGKSDESQSPRTTALLPNRTVVSPAPAESDGKRERVRKRVSDEAIGGIESLIPKSRAAKPGGAGTSQSSPHRNGASAVESTRTNGGHVGEHMDDLGSGTPAARKSRKPTEAEEALGHLNGHASAGCGAEQQAAHAREIDVKSELCIAASSLNGSSATSLAASHAVTPIAEDSLAAHVSEAAVELDSPPGPLVMWTPPDDALLLMCCENGLGFDVAAAEMPFTSSFTAADLEARWYKLLYDQDTAGEVAMEVVALEHEVACPRAVMKKGFQSRTGEPSRQLAWSLLARQALPDVVTGHGMTAVTSPSVAAGQLPYAAVDGQSCHCVIYTTEFSIGRRCAGMEVDGDEANAGAMKVDVDLSGESGDVGKISRKHVVCVRDGRGSWFMTNLGKRPVYVNGTAVQQGGKNEVYARSVMVICGVRITFASR